MNAEMDIYDAELNAAVRAWCARNARGLRTRRAETLRAALRDGTAARVRYDATRDVYELEAPDGRTFTVRGFILDAAGPARHWRQDATAVARVIQALRRIFAGVAEEVRPCGRP